MKYFQREIWIYFKILMGYHCCYDAFMVAKTADETERRTDNLELCKIAFKSK